MGWEYSDIDLGDEATIDFWREAEESWRLITNDDDKGE